MNRVHRRSKHLSAPARKCALQAERRVLDTAPHPQWSPPKPLSPINSYFPSIATSFVFAGSRAVSSDELFKTSSHFDSTAKHPDWHPVR